MNNLQKNLWLPALSLLCCLPSSAETVYKSIDDSGVVSFSDTPPTNDVPVETVVIEVAAPPPSDLTEQRLEDMRETTDRMVADRMGREKHRAELRQLDAQKYAEKSSQDMTGYYDTNTIYTGYYPYPRHRNGRHPNRPVHPIVRPPLLSPTPHQQPSYDYPASLIRKSYDPKVRAALR